MKKVNAANGMTVEKAAEQNLLQPGDIIGFKIDGHPSAGHTVTYVGKNSNGVPLCYDGGGVAKSLGYGTVGVGPVKYNNKNYYKDELNNAKDRKATAKNNLKKALFLSNLL